MPDLPDPVVIDSDPAPGRWFPGWIGRVILALPLVALLWFRVADPAGDRGSVNFFTLFLGGVFVLLWLAWFLVASRQPWKRRLALVGSLVLAVGLFLLLFRFERLTGEMMPVFVPRMAETPQPLAEKETGGAVGAIDLTTETDQDFPQFLGPDRDQSVDDLELEPDWKAHPPQELWRRPMGAGLGGFAVRNGYAITLEQRGGDELVTCYRVVDGEPCWSWSHPSRYESVVAGDGPRSTPTIYDGKVYAQMTYGLLVALDGNTGGLLWQRELEDDLGSNLTPEASMEILPYGRSGSPLIHPAIDGGNLLIIPGGGTAESGFSSLMAYDRHTGEPRWRSGDRQISCSSPAYAELGGRGQILSVDEDRAAGYDPADGSVLWSHPWPGRTAGNASVSQPIPLPPDRVFLSKGYGVGAALLEMRPAGDGFEAEELWHRPRSLRTKFTNVVIWEGHVYGLSDGILECVDLETGERKWKKGRYQQGQILRVGSHLLVLAESGELTLVAASPDEANETFGSVQAVEGKTWNNLALYGDILLVRNGVEAAAFRLKLAGTS